jgi:hypothetical protein
MMQQTVLITAIRGPDGIAKYDGVKSLLRWYRRCVLLSAMDGRALTNPYETNGGSFTGPSMTCCREDWETGMECIASDYVKSLDALPHHFQMHLMHAVEIVGYHHPDERIRTWFNRLYRRLTNDMHLHEETISEMDERLGDSRSGWLKRADPATIL